jgi:ribonucleoside-diphosphate reductase alpha chain
MKLYPSLEERGSATTLCTLGAINWGILDSPDELESLCDMQVRMLDSLIQSNVYLNKLSETETKASRFLGIGITNFAYFLAKRHLKYQDLAAIPLVHEYAEAHMYYLLKASNNLAKEHGACEHFYRTKYSHGLLPIDHYNKNVDKLYPNELKCDWETLRVDILKNGLRHSTVMACMPVQSSSVVSGATNGVEPPRAFLNKIKSKQGLMPQIVPEYKELQQYYTLMYDKDLTPAYLKLMAIIQKFADQGISVNTYYSPAHYADNKVPQSVVVQDILNHYKYGGKTMYYNNIDDGRDKQESDVVPVLEFSMPSGGTGGASVETYVDADGIEKLISCDCPILPELLAECDACTL